MKRFMLLHIGFEQPTQDIMRAWQAWFASVAACTVEQGGCKAGREITKNGVRDLAWGADAITGYNVIEAQSLEAAEKIAATCPIITAIRVYELR